VNSELELGEAIIRMFVGEDALMFDGDDASVLDGDVV